MSLVYELRNKKGKERAVDLKIKEKEMKKKKVQGKHTSQLISTLKHIFFVWFAFRYDWKEK